LSLLYGSTPFFEKVKKEIVETRDVGHIIRAVMDPVHGKEISSLVPKLVKDPSKIPKLILSSQEEIASLEQMRKVVSEQYSSSLRILKAEESSDPKAKQAVPGKPAIIVK